MAYALRAQAKKNYKELSDVRLPRALRQGAKTQTKDDLYDVEVVDEDQSSGRVKVHYVGYGEECDEWKEQSDVVYVCHNASKCHRHTCITNESGCWFVVLVTQDFV